MSQTHTEKAKGEFKKHGDILESAIKEFDAHAVDPEGVDPVPPPDTGGHPHSPAAHLDTDAKPHTKPAGDLRQGAAPGALREPPQEVSRIGKEHRGQ